VLKTIFYSLAALVRKILFSPLEDKKSYLRAAQPRTQALSSTLLAGENTLAGAGHVYPKFWVAKSIIAMGGVVEESVCRVWKIATLCFIVSGDKHALYNKKS
jgi:hypothetical protein